MLRWVVFIGHFALGFAAKRATPQISLAVLFAAAQLADLIWPVLVALSIEQVRIDPGNTAFTPLDFVSYPYSHSLALLVGWGLAFALIYRAASGRNGRTVLVLAVLVVSHWILDWLTHRPDMPLYPGGPKVGIGLWNSVAWTLVVELAMFAVGVWIYARATRAVDGVGRWAFAALIAVLLAIYALNLAGGPPPSVSAIWIAGLLGGGLLLVWAKWMDRHRAAVVCENSAEIG